MKKQILTFGLISGAILGGATAVMVALCMNDTAAFDYAEICGYTIQVLAYLLVFFAIRSYRESVGGTITFGKAFQVGILATLVACAVYVVSWEIVYYNFIPDFGDKYAAHMLERMKAKGESAQAIEKATREMAKFKEMYKNPFFNTGMTLLEVFPVGLIMTLISAAILRRKTPPPAPSAATAAAG
ncbi:MAG TPA: DUF4199 domain-containing protein [Thermoanaerobaculia bacterium]|nr:DUF4199 domain-containing protein [Thermoanaerobaculia bacterium]